MRRMRFWMLSVIALAVFLQSNRQASAQFSEYVREHYTKYEYKIPMRDGVKLYTIVYVPKDKSKTYPIILKRTPYSVRPYGPDKYIERVGNQRRRYFQEGYIVAFQDVRGRYMSEGDFVHMRPVIERPRSKKQIDETTDTYDTVDWLVKHIPNNNGRVGISGISYPGFYSTMGAIHAHPAVKAVSPQAPVTKWMAGDDWFHNGAFLISHAFGFLIRFGWPRPKPKSEPDPSFDYGTPDGYKFYLNLGPLPNANRQYMHHQVAFWDTLMRHGTWDDFWASRSVLPHLRNIKPAMLVVGGWFDTENLYGALHTYATIEKNNPKTVNHLVMGPWYHGQWSRGDGRSLGDINFGSRTSEFYTEHVEVPFFNYYLKGQGRLDMAEAVMFETGANEWHFLDRWPPDNRDMRKLYLRDRGRLSFTPPVKSEAEYDEYISDPAHPVPYTAEITHWYNPAFMIEDQRFADRRPDVLVFQTEPLGEDLSVAGPVKVSFYVSTSGTDSDWIVKLIDVFPDTMQTREFRGRKVEYGGFEMLVRGDVLRGKFRNSLANPEPFVPNQVTKIEFTLQDVFHRFKKRHRIMVQVQSTWFPMIDINPQTFVNIYQAKPEDFQKATQRVYHTPALPSHLEIGIMR
ncbi:MAG: CocE/NonD family hydrolase [candidate division KSB1 bacterium]|nr:CocE/NonD family hydrolase [candidate division KSB1 bacterium]